MTLSLSLSIYLRRSSTPALRERGVRWKIGEVSWTGPVVGLGKVRSTDCPQESPAHTSNSGFSHHPLHNQCHSSREMYPYTLFSQGFPAPSLRSGSLLLSFSLLQHLLCITLLSYISLCACYSKDPKGIKGVPHSSLIEAHSIHHTI